MLETLSNRNSNNLESLLRLEVSTKRKFKSLSIVLYTVRFYINLESSNQSISEITPNQKRFRRRKKCNLLSLNCIEDFNLISYSKLVNFFIWHNWICVDWISNKKLRLKPYLLKYSFNCATDNGIESKSKMMMLITWLVTFFWVIDRSNP